MGEIKEGRKDGVGIMIYSDGTRYEGHFRNDVREGFGVMYYRRKKYSGTFHNDTKHGHAGVKFYLSILPETEEFWENGVRIEPPRRADDDDDDDD